MQLIDKMTK